MSERYTDWLSNKKTLDDLKEHIKKAGTPLELRTKKFLRDNGFSVRSMRYLSQSESGESSVWRELDIHAFRIEEPPITIGNSKIQFMTHIIGECKYSSDFDVFVFEHSDKENADVKLLPIKINGQKILSRFIDFHFKFPLLIERAIYVNVDERGNRGKGNYNDSEVHRACEQVLDAVDFYCNRTRRSVINEYHNFWKNSAIMSLWQDKLKAGIEYEEQGAMKLVPEKTIEEFLKNEFKAETMMGDFPYIMIHIVIPLIVFDENRGMIKVGLDAKNNINGFEDVGYCLYPYTSENSERYDNVLEGHFNFPIILANYNHLDKAMVIINNGIKAMIAETQQQLTEKPHLIPKEIIFNPDLEFKGRLLRSDAQRW